MDQRKSTGFVISCSAGVSMEHYSYDSPILETIKESLKVNFYCRVIFTCVRA